MYRRIDPEAPLEQGEIVDDCPILYWHREEKSTSWNAAESSERIVVLTQACDLANPISTRVQVATVHEADRLVELGVLKPQTIRDQLVRHRVYGWYFLPAFDDFP